MLGIFEQQVFSTSVERCDERRELECFVSTVCGETWKRLASLELRRRQGR